MKHMIMIALGGALGAMSRYSLGNWVNSLSVSKFPAGNIPYGTLAVNVIGSFFIGIMYVLITEKLALHADWRNVIIVGFLGAFTTFATFSLETITLMENGYVVESMIYVVGSLLVCFMAVWTAIYITRLI
ncbi:MAG: CrcB protein [Gammaproteobacteria bacterium]|jgi:CrcB protein